MILLIRFNISLTKVFFLLISMVLKLFFLYFKRCVWRSVHFIVWCLASTQVSIYILVQDIISQVR